MTQGLLAIPNAQRLLSMGSRQSQRHEQQLKDPLNAEAWHKETNELLASQNLVIVNVTTVSKGYKAIGYTAVFKKKFHPVTATRV